MESINSSVQTNSDSGQDQHSRSFWISSIDPLMFDPLQQDMISDVVVVGAGIAGLTIAYKLASEGKDVVVLERDLIGSGETGHTTAHITHALDDRYAELEKMFGEEKTRLAAQSHTAAIDFIDQVVRKENIQCDFMRVDGYLFLHPSDEISTLEEELKATRRAGLLTEMTENIPGIDTQEGPALRFQNQAQFHPLKYLHGLCQAILKYGGKIYTGTMVKEFNQHSVKTEHFTVKANHIIVATNTPVNDLVTMHTKQFPYRSYVIGASIPKGVLKPALWWDTGELDSPWPTDPYHYVRLQPFSDTEDLLIIGGEDHKTGQPGKENIEESQRFDYLEAWAKIKFPQITRIIHRWSGQVMEPVDSLAFIGRNPGDENIYIVTGDSGNGMTHCTIAGMLIPDLIMGRSNPWEKLYSPSRLPVRAFGQYITEAANMAAQYADYLMAGDIESVNELSSNEGAVMKASGKRVAVYKDEHGALYAYSAVCPHLGCSVRWNSFEKTFDCPCHGSRFTTAGKVINGPANSDLKPIEIKYEEITSRHYEKH